MYNSRYVDLPPNHKKYNVSIFRTKYDLYSQFVTVALEAIFFTRNNKSRVYNHQIPYAGLLVGVIE